MAQYSTAIAKVTQALVIEPRWRQLGQPNSNNLCLNIPSPVNLVQKAQV
jgi:hypothetical protein